MVPNTFTVLNDFVSSDAPICYGILKPGSHIEDGISVIKVKNIYSGKIHTEKLLKTSIDIHQQYKRAELKSGDVLLTIRGTTGRVAIVQEELDGANITQDTARIRVSTEDCSLYLFYALQSPQTQRQIKLNTVGQAVKGINIAEVKKLNILHPPYKEQRKIANILGVWDKAITTAECIVDNSKQQKKALMQQLITGKKRLLNNSGKKFKGEWKEIKLGDVLTKISNGLTYDSKATTGLPVSRIESISTGKVNHNKVGYAPDDTKTEKFKLLNGDILYSHINSLKHIGRVAYFKNDKTLYHGMNLLLLRAPDSTESKFIFYLLLSSVGKAFAKSHAKSAVNQASISTTDLKSFKVKLPLIDEQKKIATVLTNADKEIELLEQQLADLKQEKKALMQQLLTGKRRVKVGKEAM
jgi:type I restriction enzyme S subunit